VSPGIVAAWIGVVLFGVLAITICVSAWTTVIEKRRMLRRAKRILPKEER